MIASSVAWVSALDSSADSAEREPLTISIVTVCGVGLALSCHRVLLQRFAGDCVVGVGDVPFSKGRGR